MAGTTPHMVSHIFSAREAVGLVEPGRRKLLVRNPHGLMLLAEGEHDRR